MARKLLRFLGRLAAWPLALVILFEEWGWEPLQRAVVRMAEVLGLQRLEAFIRTLPPYPALALFLLPSLLLLPAKLLALWLLGHGQVLLGTLVILSTKLVGTAVVARLFSLTRDSLLQLGWFARLYGHWSAFKEALLVRVRASWPWRWGRAMKRHWQRRWRVWRHG